MLSSQTAQDRVDPRFLQPLWREEGLAQRQMSLWDLGAVGIQPQQLWAQQAVANAVPGRREAVGDMRVHFDTQRQLKSRDELAETLDIRIVDGAGERPYDNYSGGEQFRINFAIRLALSQVLAKRAGARLQTLVIDEGFGSQDPNGRQRLVEAINTIQNEFARILVITHIDELRDAFPNRIDVEKTAVGSTIAVV